MKAYKKRILNLRTPIVTVAVWSIFSGLLLVIRPVAAGNEPVQPVRSAQLEEVLVGPSNKDTKLSENAARQIAALAEEKQLRTPAQQKIDSNLLFQIKMDRGEEIARGISTLETGLTVDGDGQIDVDITANVNRDLLNWLKQAGTDIFSVFPQYHSITARINIGSIETLAGRGDVIFVQPKLQADTNQKEKNSDSEIVGDRAPVLTGNLTLEQKATNVRKTIQDAFPDGARPDTGSANSEGDTTHLAASARTLFGTTGAGIKIGVLSDGVNTLAARQVTGDLPAGVTVLPGQAGSGDEGTAMLEIIHDIAPGSQLYFATAFTSITSFAANIKALRAAGCDIIIDDVSYLVESPFQNGQAPSVVSPGNAGIVTQAVIDVTVGSQAGALYFSSAGNSGNKNDSTAGAWEGDFVDGGPAPEPLPGAAGNVHNFGGGNLYNVVSTNGTSRSSFLKWSDPLGASSSDYDLYYVDLAGTAVTGASTNVQNGTQDPVEVISSSSSRRVYIVKKAGSAPRFLHLNANRNTYAISTPGIVYGHNGALNTISCAAVPVGPAVNNASVGPFPNAFTSANMVETFSSDGPRRIFFNADGTAITPGNVSATGGQLLQKPDITAADGVTTTTPGFVPFFGTSAAAPHAGALMALLKAKHPTFTSAHLYDLMMSSAIDIEAPGTDRDSGAGIFMPIRALARAGGIAVLELGAVTATEISGNGNDAIEPGEEGILGIQIKNPGVANATAISAVLNTSTAGISILTPNNRGYPTIAAGGDALIFTPWRFILSNGFPCSGIINFTLTVTYLGGLGTQVFDLPVTTGKPTELLSTTLDTTPPPLAASYTASTGTQTGRLARNGVVSGCATAKPSPGLNDAIPDRRFDSYVFTAHDTGCITVSFTTGTALFVAAYGPGGFVSSNPATNYLADAGSSFGGPSSFSFNVAAGQTFTVVVHEVNAGTGIGTNYNLAVLGSGIGACQTTAANGGATISGRVTTSSGQGLRNATVTIIDPAGSTRTTVTSSFGTYQFEGLEVGRDYMITVTSKRFRFATRTVSLTGNLADVNLIGLE